MLDSTAKIQSGLIQGHMINMGNFFECLNIKAISSKQNQTILGEHCMINIPINAILKEFGIDNPHFSTKSPLSTKVKYSCRIIFCYFYILDDVNRMK